MHLGSRLATTLFWLLLGGLVLISAALYNGYPLVTPDTGTYIDSALTLNVPEDRPVTYGLFILATGFKKTLWFVVFAQSLLVAWLALRYAEVFVTRLAHPFWRVALLALTAWATGVAWYASQLMPDIFTATGLLALGLVLIGRSRSKLELACLLLLVLTAELMHNSNLLTYSLTVVGFGIVAWVKKLFQRQIVRPLYWLLATVVVLSGWVVLPTINKSLGGDFTVSRASHAFLMARLVEAGVMDKFLKENCGPANSYSLCAYRDQLPNDAIGFIWDGNSPLSKAGGWGPVRDEYNLIIRDILTSPRYYPYLITDGIQSTLRQLTHISHGDGLQASREDSNPYKGVRTFAPYELKKYMTSLQNRGQLNFTTLNERTYAVHLWAIGLLGVLLATPLRRRLTRDTVPVLVILGFGILANAFVTGALANVLDRLQSRVSWVLPFIALLLLAEHGPALVQYLYGVVFARKDEKQEVR
ncbi:hypothetical protein [Hymenobacter sp. GOD-10R]|uniref:hypothetical protein n=1 Tax=Hymenobacter sp. GOD-10R TaxID=3093922 RepID=UPI002D7872BC|nr:hypothetical protein [Hymenobacter sp. GOD-10R]WRQ28309.1 hypothetical protein SD425_24890 [Hymenobacter sp. GOD-10R]